MSCRILTDVDGLSCFYCSTSSVAFGPVMPTRETAYKFQEWMIEHRSKVRPDIKVVSTIFEVRSSDPRSYHDDDLLSLYHSFLVWQDGIDKNDSTVIP